jgi:hypothetical protein
LWTTPLVGRDPAGLTPDCHPIVYLHDQHDAPSVQPGT